MTSAAEKGKATKSYYNTPGTIIGKALCEPKYFDEHDCEMVLMQIMLA